MQFDELYEYFLCFADYDDLSSSSNSENAFNLSTTANIATLGSTIKISLPPTDIGSKLHLHITIPALVTCAVGLVGFILLLILLYRRRNLHYDFAKW